MDVYETFTFFIIKGYPHKSLPLKEWPIRPILEAFFERKSETVSRSQHFEDCVSDVDSGQKGSVFVPFLGAICSFKGPPL